MSSSGSTTNEAGIPFEAVRESLRNEIAHMTEEAQQHLNDYVRMRQREDEFLRQVMSPVPITTDEHTWHEELSPPPPRPVPENRYIHGPRYRVMFDRIMAPRFRTSVEELRSYDMDIRAVLTRNAIVASQVALRERGYRTLREIREAKYGA